MRAAVILLVLALAGCASGDLFHQEEPRSAPQESAPPVASTPSSVPLSSPAAKAAAAPNATASSDGLLDCVTESCKINCSPKVKKQFRPKWCARFKEPVE